MKHELIYRVRFREGDKGSTAEVLVGQVEQSSIPGLVCLSKFIFKDTTKKIIMPEEDAASKRFRQTETLHIPYHSIILIEQFYDEPVDLKKLPFLKNMEEKGNRVEA